VKSLIEIQQAYIDAVNAGAARWAHRRDGGHMPRIARGARRRLERALTGLGFTPEGVAEALKQARDMAELERMAEVE